LLPGYEVMIELQRAIRIAITIAAVIVAVFVVRWMWIHYEREPWTRDGRIRADTVEVASDVTGLVTEVHVIDNSIVRKGQVLFVVDRARYALALAQAEATIHARNLERPMPYLFQLPSRVPNSISI